MSAFDPIDYQILALLQEDARTTQMAIAEAVGLSQPAVADRVRKLEERGAITGYVARLDPRLQPRADVPQRHRPAALPCYEPGGVAPFFSVLPIGALDFPS